MDLTADHTCNAEWQPEYTATSTDAPYSRNDTCISFHQPIGNALSYGTSESWICRNALHRRDSALGIAWRYSRIAPILPPYGESLPRTKRTRWAYRTWWPRRTSRTWRKWRRRWWPVWTQWTWPIRTRRTRRRWTRWTRTPWWITGNFVCRFHGTPRIQLQARHQAIPRTQERRRLRSLV